MDFHCMKRKQLQALCKKHKIPANLSNLEMAKKLTEFLKDAPLMMEKEENAREAQSKNVPVNRKVTKVRFSPEHELIEFTRSPGVKRRRKNSVCHTDSNWSAEIVESGERSKETVGRGGRATRSRELIMEKKVNQKKRGTKAVKCNNGKTNVSAVETFENNKLEGGEVVDPGRLTRTRRKIEAQGVENASKRERKYAKDEKAADGLHTENHSRVTRSRAQILKEAPSEVGKRGRKVVSTETVENGESGADSSNMSGVECEGTSATGSHKNMKGNGEGLKEKLANKKIQGECLTVEPQVLLRRSKRKGNVVRESEIFIHDTKKHENGGTKGSKETSKLLASDGSQVHAEVVEDEVNLGARAVLKIEEPLKKVETRRCNRRKNLNEADDLRTETENRYPLMSSVDGEVIENEVNLDTRAVLKVEEPIKKVEPRRSNRRKTMVESDDLRAETENRYPGIAPEVCKDDKMVLQPTGVMRRSRRKTCLKLDSANVTDSAIEKMEPEKHVSKLCLVEKENDAVQKNTRPRRNTTKCKPPGIIDKVNEDSNTYQKSKVTKRKRGNASGGDVIKNNDDLDSGRQCLNGSSSKKVVSAAATGKLVDEGKKPLILDNPNVLDASRHGSSGNEESLFLAVQRSVSKVAESGSNFCSNNIIGDMELTSIRKTHKNKEEVSLADNAGSSSMNLIDGEVLKNLDTNAIAQLQPDSTFSEYQNCSTNSPLECDVQQPTEKNITDFGNKNNNQVLTEGLNVSGREGSDTTPSCAECLLLGDQTDVTTNLKVAETEADELAQPCPRVVNHHNDLDKDKEDASQTAGEDRTFVSCDTDCAHSVDTPKVPLLSMTRPHGNNAADRSETLFYKGIASEIAEADEDACSKEYGNASNHLSEFDKPDQCNGETHEGESSQDNKSKCDEDGAISLPNLFDAEGRYEIIPQDTEKFSGEILVKDFDDQGILYASTSGALITMSNSVGDNAEFTEADESGCIKSHKSSKEELWELSDFNLFDAEKINKIENEDIGVVSAKSPTKNLEEHEIFPKLPDVSTVCESYAEVKSGIYSSNSQESNPSTPSSVSEYKAEQPKSLSAKCSTVGNTHLGQENWSHASEMEGNAVEGLSAEEDVNHANYVDIEDPAGACISDVINRPISKRAAESPSGMKFQDSLGTEQKNKNLLSRQTESDAGEEATDARPSQSWTEIELYNLFGTTSDEDAPPGLGDTFSEGTETANITIPKIKSAANNSGSLTKTKGKEMERDSRNECAKTDEDTILPTGFDAVIYENELQSLFATPVQNMTPCKTEETYSHEGKLDMNVTSILERCSDTVKKDVATENTSNGKAEDAGYEVENNLRTGDSLSDNGGDDICEGINEIENFELLNTSAEVLSRAEYDGSEGLEDHLAQNTKEVREATNLITEDKEENVIPLAKPCLLDESTKKDIISSSTSPCDLDELASCTDMSETLSYQIKADNKFEGEMTQNTAVVVELSDADPQKSDVPQNRNLHMVGSHDVNILMETLIKTSDDPEVAKSGSCHKDVADKGISFILFSEGSADCEASTRESNDQSASKLWDEKDGNPKLSQDISDEQHTDSEMVIEKSVSIGYNLCQGLDQLPISDELESTCEEAKGMGTTAQIQHDKDAAAEHESVMPACLGYHENGDKKLEAGELSENGEKATLEIINKVESIELKDASTEAICETEYDSCEASEKQLTEYTGQCQKETNSITENNEEKVIPLGKTLLFDEGTDNKSESTEGNSLSGSPNNLDKLEGCQDILTDTSLLESLSHKSRVDHKSDQETAQNSDGSPELCDAYLQKYNVSKNSHLVSCFEDDFSKEALLTTFCGSLVADLAEIGSFDCQNDIDKGTPLRESSMASPVSNELAQRKDIDLNGAKICDETDAQEKTSKDMSDEPCINSKVAILESLSDSDNLSDEADKLPCSVELESVFLEESDKDPNTIVVPADHRSSLCGAVSSMPSSSEMILHLTDEDDDVENLSRDDEKKSEENSVAPMLEFHFEESARDFKSDLHASGYNEILKESDVADTIKEYIDSESSLSVIFDNSNTSLSVDMFAHTEERTTCENSTSSIHKDDIARRPVDEDIMPSVNCLETEEIKEQEEAGRVGCLTKVKLDSRQKMDSLDGDELCSTVRKNVRTIMIHGTPGKLESMADMKENAPKHKSSNMGDITAVRPAKRRALQDLQWK